jgi:hypothetical protein
LLSAQAKKQTAFDTSGMTAQQSAMLDKAARTAKSGRSAQAINMLQSILSTADDVSQCLAVASATEREGFTMQDIRRAALRKALSLSKTRDDYFRCALKARQLQCFDVTSEAVKALLSSSSSTDELLDLARKAQEISLNDVSHLALEKAFTQTKTQTDALALAKQCRLLGADDLAKKICKELIDDLQSPHDLCELFPAIEQFEYPQANRYLLKKALEWSKTIDDYRAIYDTAKRVGQKDVEEVALFRGRQLVQMQKLQEEAAKAASTAAADAQSQQTRTETGKQSAGSGF